MATFIEDLGIVSAYGEAVRKGYTGTEEEFAEMLANLPDKLAEAREYAASAAESSASAASSAAGVQRNASIASTAASDAQSAAASALQSVTFAETTVEGIEEHEEQCRIYRAEAVAAAEELKTTTLWNDALIDETVTGRIASFDDGCVGMPLKSLVTGITPEQDLNGYSKPWPGGGGKNLLQNTAQTTTAYGVTFTVNSDGTVSTNGTSTHTPNYIVYKVFTLKAGTYIFSGCPSGGSSSTYYQRINYGSSASSTASVRVATDTGSGATFTLAEDSEICVWMDVDNGANVSGKVFQPMIRLETETDGTFAPYSNICPISGRTGLTVAHSGKNLLKNTGATVTSYGITYTKNDDGSVTVSGTSTKNANYFHVGTITLPAGTYILTGCPSGGSATTYYLRVRQGTSIVGSEYGDGKTFTLNSETELNVVMSVDNGTTLNNTFYPMIRLSSVADASFEPYTGTEIPITWESIAGTVYGGTLDVVSGVLTVDRACYTAADFPSHAKSSSTSFDEYFFRINADQTPAVGTAANEDLICSHAVRGATSGANYVQCRFASNQPRILFPVGTMSTISDFDTWLADQVSAGTPLQFSYVLATPQTYQLTPTEVRTLLGENLVYSDADDVTVNYYVDMKGYIDKRLNTTRMMIAGVETSFVATKNYAIGDFVIVNDTLYRITAVITSGETITPGTNASETTVAEQLIALYNA